VIDAMKKFPDEDFQRPWPPLINLTEALTPTVGKFFHL